MAVSYKVFARNFKKMSPVLDKAVIGAMRAYLLRTMKTVKRDYIVGGGGPPNPPPGPLKNRTGRLRGSISIREPRKTGRSFIGGVRAGARYGRFHEFGTRRMGARPFLEPPLRKHIKQFEKEVAVAYETAARGLFK